MNGSLTGIICLFSLLLIPLSSARADLIINEVMYNPSSVSDTDGEWFELHNTGADLDLQGYSIADSTSQSVIDQSLVIAGGGYLVFGKNADSVANGGVTVDDTFSFSLSNSGESLYLLDPAGMQIDSITYGSGTGFPSGTGASISFTGVGDNSDGANWMDTRDLGLMYGLGDYGTPGAANMTPVPEPMSLFLIGSGLVGILMARRRE